jgi:hypothetical protein
MARWTEKDEKEPSKLVYKFGVLSIFNQPRNLKKGILHAGKATNVKADVFIKQVAVLQNKL